MPVLRRETSDSRTELDAEALQRLVVSQHGVVSRQQLQSLGLSGARMARWLGVGRLHRIHPRVYAVGHTALSLNGRLVAGLLYAGDEAVLSHTTAAWVWSLIEAEPTRIRLTVPGRRRSLPDVRVHHSRQVDRAECGGLAVTSVARTIVDIAAMLGKRQLRRVLAEADFQHLLDPRDWRPRWSTAVRDLPLRGPPFGATCLNLRIR